MTEQESKKQTEKQIEWYTEKYQMKLGDCLDRNTRNDWVNGIGGLPKSAKEQIIKNLDKIYGK